VAGLKTNERPGTRAVLRHSRVSAYKAREVLNLIRGQDYQRAMEILEFCDRGVAEVIGKLLHSAASNARHNDGLDPEEMFVAACFADEGTTLPRWRPRARGRASRIRKRTCHITVILSRMPDDQLSRRRARVAAEQSDRRARRVAGGLRRNRVAASTGAGAAASPGKKTRRDTAATPETEATSEALAALEEARALETASHHEELEAEAESALDEFEHEHDDVDEDGGDTAGGDTDTHDTAGDESASADATTKASSDESSPTGAAPEAATDETDVVPSSGVADDEAEASPPESSSDAAPDVRTDGEEN
jgi:large subunit ribosomal protein L22